MSVDRASSYDFSLLVATLRLLGIGTRVLLKCTVGLFYGWATVYAFVYSAKQIDFRTFLYDHN